MASDDNAASRTDANGSGEAHGDDNVAAASAATPGASATSSAESRMPYTPQFSASTQMILKRLRTGEPGGLNAAISSATSASSFNKDSWDDARRRLVMSMQTSLTMPFPEPSSAPPPSSAPAYTSPKVTNEGTQGGRGNAAQVATSSPARGAQKATVRKGRAAPPRGSKRKRIKQEDGSLSKSDSAGSDGEDRYQDSAVLTMTKSGRQVLKPTQYNPVTAGAQGKKKHWGKRTEDQMLCKLCMRGLSPANNQIVFCDGCNSCWHQRCHDPFIDDEFVSNETRAWFCMNCLAKKEKQATRRKQAVEKPVEASKEVNWASRTRDQLVDLLMQSLELHPDLPLFPGQESSKSTKGTSQAASSTRNANSLYLPMPATSSKSIPSNVAASSNRRINSPAGQQQENGKRGSASRDATIDQEQAAREDSEDSVPPSWPKPGQGVLAGITMNESDFEDRNDYEAFSVATYDAKGKKIVENGMLIKR